MKDTVAAQKALQGSEAKTSELLERGKEINTIPEVGVIFCPPGKTMIFFPKKHTEKIQLVARPRNFKTANTVQTPPVREFTPFHAAPNVATIDSFVKSCLLF